MGMISVEEAAKRLGVSERAVRNGLNKDNIQGIKVSGEWRVNDENIPPLETAGSKTIYDLSTLDGKVHYCAETKEGMDKFADNVQAMFSGDKEAEADCQELMTYAYGCQKKGCFVALAQVWYGCLADYLAGELLKVAGNEESPAYLNYVRWGKFMECLTGEDKVEST